MLTRGRMVPNPAYDPRPGRGSSDNVEYLPGPNAERAAPAPASRESLVKDLALASRAVEARSGALIRPGALEEATKVKVQAMDKLRTFDSTAALQPAPQRSTSPGPVIPEPDPLAVKRAASTQPRTTPGPVIPEPDPLAPKPGDMLARRIEFAKELKGQVSSGKYDQEGARKKASELGITPEDFGRFAKRELWPTPTPTPTPKPAPAASTLSPDLIAARASFGRQLDQQSMSGGFNLEDAQRDAAALSITPEQFNAFVAARKPLSQMRAQQERQQVEAIGSSSALNLRRGLQTEAGRMRSVGRQVGRDIKRGMDPEFARQAGLLKMTTPGIRSVDQGIAEREGQEKTAAAFQANENQYAKLMQDADTDPDLKRKLDRMLAKRAKKAA